MTDQAVAVWTAEGAARSLTRAMSGKKARSDLAALLGVELDSPRGLVILDNFVSVALHAAVSDPKLLRATKESLLQSIRDAALLGLQPVGVTGDGAIVVYDETVKEEQPGRHGGTIIVQKKVPTAHFQPMYRGLLKLARRSDQIAHVDAHVVYEGDKIELDLGSTPKVSHYPVLDGNARGDTVGAYAVAELLNGRRYVEWMTTADIEIVRKSARGQSNDSPWVKFWPEMARKTVLRRLMKRLPLETMAEHGLRLEAEAESRGSAPALEAGAPIAEIPAESGARRRLRERFVPPSDPVPDGPEPTAPTTSDGDATTPASEEDPAVLGRPTASDAENGASEAVPVSGEVIEAPQNDQDRSICGATSDPELGDVETCILPPGHHYPDSDKPNPHESKERSRWPNRG